MLARAVRASKRLRKGFDLFVLGGYFFSILYSALIIIPLYFVIVSAFKNNSQIILTPLALPTSLNFQKFIQVQDKRQCSAGGVDHHRDHHWARSC